MSREPRNWNNIDAVQYFNEHYKGRIISRSQLEKEDRGLYNKLRKLGKLDEILPNLYENHRDFTQITPVKYFKKFYKGKITARNQLQKEDPTLYNKLRKLGKLDDILPSQNESYRDFSKTDPVQYFKKHYKGKIKTRKQLAKEDQSLYQKLRELGKLSQLLPDIQNRDYSKTDPVRYFKEHYTGKITTRWQLQKEDQGLYQKLRTLGKLDEVLPDLQLRDYSKIDPVRYFKEHYAGKITTRSQLEKKDRGLYEKLLKLGKLDEVFPKKSSLDDILLKYTYEEEATGAIVKK